MKVLEYLVVGERVKEDSQVTAVQHRERHHVGQVLSWRPHLQIQTTKFYLFNKLNSFNIFVLNDLAFWWIDGIHLRL